MLFVKQSLAGTIDTTGAKGTATAIRRYENMVPVRIKRWFERRQIEVVIRWARSTPAERG